MFPRLQPIGLSFALAVFGFSLTHVEARVIASAPGQPAGALSGRIVYMSAGHGWTYSNASDKWYTQRADNNDVVEDYGNLDQMNLFAAYCFHAGATVVSFRPLGYQTNEVVLDNTSPSVRFVGAWSNSSATNNYFGRAGEVGYRFAGISAIESATATYAPTIPSAGFYPVYAWASHGGNRTLQLYLINHSGGQAQVRVPHHMVGNGWVYLGNYYFEKGSNALAASVVISNLEPTPGFGTVVVADAVRFGNGMGDVIPVSTGGGVPTVSGYPREEECARYWIQRMLGVGAAAGIYDGGSDDGSDNVGAPPRMAREMNRSEAGDMAERLFVSFHSNASGVSPPPATARGCTALYNNESLFPGTATPNQQRLAYLIASELNADLLAQSSPPTEVPWHGRSDSQLTFARDDFAFGEINNTAISDEFDATILEVAFHDHPDDALLLRDPRVRNIVARSAYQGVVRYMNEFAGTPLVFLPEPPVNVRAVADQSGGIVVSWSPPGNGGGAASGYRIYRSGDGYGFGEPMGVNGLLSTSTTFTNLAADVAWFFRVVATNAGGESMPSESVGCRRSSIGGARVLFVNGFDRFDRTLNVRQTAGPGIGGPNGGSATFERIQPRLMNSFDYVVQHGKAVSQCGVPFDSCQNEAVLNVQVQLTNYPAVIWALGEESTADETFSNAEQNRVTAYLKAGGRLFVSGSEIAWDLDRAVGPTAGDRSFLANQLHAALAGDANDDAGTQTAMAVSRGIFSGGSVVRFDDGAAGIYNVRFPDVLTPTGSGAIPALSYSGGRAGAAAIQNVDEMTGSRLVYFGFPFETITNDSVRESCMFDVLAFFGVIPAPVIEVSSISPMTGTVVLSWTAIPGRRYRLQFSESLAAESWVNAGGTILADGPVASATDAAAGRQQRFYRVMMVD